MNNKDNFENCKTETALKFQLKTKKQQKKPHILYFDQLHLLPTKNVRVLYPVCYV